MQDNNNLSNEDIRNIGNILSDAQEPVIPSVEFVFGEKSEPPKKEEVNLVFDDESSSQTSAMPSEGTGVAFEVENGTAGQDFANDSGADISNHYVPYIPRFTEASDIFYNRPISFSSSSKSSVTTNEIAETVDPTAEIYTQAQTSAPTVTVEPSNDMQSESESASQVFKFQAQLTEEESVFTEPQAPAPEEAKAEVEEQPVVEAEQELEVPETSRELVIPDHVPEKSVVGYSASYDDSDRTVLHDAPIGVGDTDQFKKKRRMEYTSHTQRDVCKDRFLDRIMSNRIRFFVMLAVFLLLTVYETASAFGVNVPALLQIDSIKGAAALIDIELTLAMFLLALPEVIYSIKSLISAKVIPELYLIATFAVLIAYNVICIVGNFEQYGLYGVIFGVLSLASVGASLFKATADFTGFKVISSGDEKRVIDKKLTRTLERENAALDGLVEEHKSKIARVFRTVFVSDFFKRSSKSNENSANVLLTLAVAAGASLVTAVVAYFIPGGIFAAASAFALVFMIACPAMAILSHKILFFYSARELSDTDSAAIGESSLYDYSDVDVITFEDTEVFGPDDVSFKRIALFDESNNLTKALRQMSALFMNLGGPLDVLFSKSLDRKAIPADNTCVEVSGISGEVDGHKILAGTLEFMRENEVIIPDEGNEKNETLLDSVRIMYAAEDGKVYAKFYIRYSFSEEFTMLLPMLDDSGIKSLVYTRDPNLTDEVFRNLTAGVDKIRVIKRTSSPETDDPLYRKVCAGMVTRGDKTNAINMILQAKKYVKLQNRMATFEIISMIVGAIFAAIVSIGGMSLLPSFVIAIWQIAWCVVLNYMGASSFAIPDLGPDKQDE